MEITPEFNRVAEGPRGEPTLVDGQSPKNLDGGSASEVASDIRFASSEGNEPAEGSPKSFAAAADSSSDEDVGQSSPGGEHESKNPALAEAEAELKRLEDERATPEAQNNLRPPSNWEKISHTDVENVRERQIFALKAYIQSHQVKPTQEADQDEGEELEFNW